MRLSSPAPPPPRGYTFVRWYIQDTDTTAKASYQDGETTKSYNVRGYITYACGDTVTTIYTDEIQTAIAQ